MRKQISPFAVRQVCFPSGERLPMLCSRASGLPLFEPTLYALTELRARNRSAATIQQALRSIMVLYLALDRLGIDLADRLGQGKLLEAGEIEEIVRACRLPLPAFTSEEAGQPLRRSTVVSLERVRMRSPAVETADVDPGTAAIRLHYIRGYLKWRVDTQLLKLSGSQRGAAYAHLRSTADVVHRALEERTPASRSRNLTGQRQGMSEEALARVLEVIKPDYPDNPWKGEHARERNALIVRWFIDLGLRRGELLGVKIPNINFQGNEVLIERRADDPDDPRINQPNAKTYDRLLPLSDELTRLTHRYITGHRRAKEGSRKHTFLFVAVATGAPLTLSSLNKVFVVLRRKCPDLPDDLSPHVLRHTWNDHFSEIMDQQGVSEETEKKMRSRLMGWSETSGTAAIYTRRHVQRKAREVSLAMQRKLNKEPSNEP
ncbi:MAG TPA: site-specific integrase [Steroidobacter sp.]|uniref:tyrosine-type recombinase/integrase n=1 Tax=Steroidobacter sp. TaxID=1978227 RepID=UPI002ED8E3BE